LSQKIGHWALVYGAVYGQTAKLQNSLSSILTAFYLILSKRAKYFYEKRQNSKYV